jgi:RimJ/RimL family protein N-acetyltransferase
MSAPACVVETPRLRLRELSPADLDFVAGMRGDAAVMRHFPAPDTRDQAAEWIQKQLTRYRADGFGMWLAERRSNAEPVGAIGLARRTIDGVPEIEVGYMIHRPFWRQHLAFEGASACRAHACRHLHASRVVALIRPENLPSQALARKLGMAIAGDVDHEGVRHLVFASDCR